MRIKLTDKEVAILIGLLGATSGQALNDVYTQLMMYASIEHPDIKDIGGMITEELIGLIKTGNINEDILYEHAIRHWNEKEGLI